VGAARSHVKAFSVFEMKKDMCTDQAEAQLEEEVSKTNFNKPCPGSSDGSQISARCSYAYAKEYRLFPKEPQKD